MGVALSEELRGRGGDGRGKGIKGFSRWLRPMGRGEKQQVTCYCTVMSIPGSIPDTYKRSPHVFPIVQVCAFHCFIVRVTGL